MTEPIVTENPRLQLVPPRSLLLLVASAIPAIIFGSGTIQAIAGLHALAASPSPYFVPAHALLLYVAAPLITLSAVALLLTPGLIAALCFARIETLPRWILIGFTVSFALVSLAAMVGQAIIRRPLTGAGFGWLVLVLAAIPLIFGPLIGATRRPYSSLPPLRARADAATLVIAAALTGLVVVVLVPKLFWENFNGDGVHMFESARLLLHQPLPFWPTAAGDIADFPDMKSMLAIYPTSWFIRLFGSNEAAARLPYVLLLAVLFCAMVAVIEEGLPRRMRAVELVLLGGGLLLFTLVMAFSVTEDPYSADLALPAVQDVLLMIFWCGFIVHFQRRDPGWMLTYIVLAYFTSPNALPLLGAWWVVALAVVRPVPRYRLGLIAGAIVALVVLESIIARLLALVGLPPPGSEHGTGALVRRLLHPQLTQVVRFAWAFVPVGLLPGVALLALRWQDRATRAISLCALIMFVFYYFQYRFALHYFVPVMILALLVLWRMILALPDGAGIFVLPLTAAMLVPGFVLSWPSDLRPAMGSRDVGEQIEDRTTGYAWSSAAVFRHSDVLQALFPRPSDPRVPTQVYGGHPLNWLYYAHEQAAASGPRAYVLQWQRDPPVPGARKIAEADKVAVYVRDQNRWRWQATRLLPDPTGSRLYVVPRNTLFTTGPRLSLLSDIHARYLRLRGRRPTAMSDPAVPARAPGPQNDGARGGSPHRR